MTENGEIVRHLTVLDGLPESDLTTLAVFSQKLFIGTKSKGLISFDGEKFEAFRLENHETKSVTALFAAPQTLLIGTFSGGLLEFDGQKITEIKAAEERLEHVTFVRETDATLIVGTFADGLWIRKNQIWKHLTTAGGLHSNRVVGAEILDKNLFVATDLGVSQTPINEILQENPAKFRQTFALPNLSSLIAENDQLYIVRDNGELFAFSNRGESSGLRKIEWKSLKNPNSARLQKANGEIRLLTDQGVWTAKNPSRDEISLAEFTKFSDSEQLADNNVSALAVDRDERLWAGTFRDGIDVFSSGGKKLRHLESETVREINSLIQRAENNEMLAATNGGAVRFGQNFEETFLVENTALPSRSVTQITNFKTEKNQASAVSTVKGLFLKENNSKRVFSTINGLPSASVFATLFAENRLFAGTMSGLAQIENGKVARVFKTSNSELKNNWITALCAAGGRIFIGTYGGGVFELLPAGEIRGFDSETGRFFVNPNALVSDGERLFAGTLSGVWCLDLTTQKWTKLKDVLPSETVLSLAVGGENLYVGTTGGIARINRSEFKL